MKLPGALLCVFVVTLDVAAGILGLHASIEQNKESYINASLIECKAPSHKAYQQGIAAVCLLLIAHIIASVAGGCICYGSTEKLNNSPVNRQIAGFCFLLSWIFLAAAVTMLVIGARHNHHSRDSCSVGHHKFLWVGGVLCFVYGAVTSAYYVSATAMITSGHGKGYSMA